jgi:medium-chain acyl-[acyl-carrier-protein] hydrolase
VFCFPHAAGSAAFYRPLRGVMPPEIDFCPVELPGRGGRLAEAPFTGMSALMAQLADALTPLMGVPFGFFGHM